MKKVLLVLSILFLTGCSVDYNMTVTNKGEVREKFYVYVDNSKILKTSSSIDEYLDTYVTSYRKKQGNEKFSIKAKQRKNDSYFLVSRKYKTLEEYVVSNSFRSMFNSASVERNGKYTTFLTSKNAYLESIKNDDLISDAYKYESFKINIRFYNEVIDSNAAEVDKKNNIYTWYVKEDNEDSYIYFKIGPKVRYDAMLLDFVDNHLAAIITVSSIVAVILGAMSYLVIKSKKNNEV